MTRTVSLATELNDWIVGVVTAVLNAVITFGLVACGVWLGLLIFAATV
jgi:hypothetical protein